MAYFPHPQRAHCGLPPMLTETLATADPRRRQSSKSEMAKIRPFFFVVFVANFANLQNDHFAVAEFAADFARSVF
jgi:hypothetical protein